LVDVMLVLLIIFMVTAPLMTAGVPVNLPDSRAKALEQDKKPASISIERDGTIYLDENKVSEEALPDALAKIAAKRDTDGKLPQVLLRADKGLDYGRVMAVMGDLNRAGLNRVSLVSNVKAER
jgi:biopolymer transport protein TolR